MAKEEVVVVGTADGNDAILAEISKLQESIKTLKKRLRPTKPRTEVSLLECNKAAKAQRAEKFRQDDRISKAVTVALSRVNEKQVRPEKKGV